MKNIVLFLFLFILFNCKEVGVPKLKEQKALALKLYEAELAVNDTLRIPFNFKVHKNNSLTIINDKENIEVNDITYKLDSVFIKLPLFEGVIKAKMNKNSLSGVFIKLDKGVKMLFKAEVYSGRFLKKEDARINIEGVWETTFSPDSKTGSYKAKGIFKQNGNEITGTFRTTTGDYRFLKGEIIGNKLRLSTFDGAYAFLFTGTVTDKTIRGMFYSGNYWEEPFVAKKNISYELPNSESLTFLKAGHDRISFSFLNENKKRISLKDKRFKDKAVLIQIMGTWCPNCLDESRYLSEFYKKNKKKNFEIVGLAFEYAKTEEKAFKNIKRLKERVGITYPILLAQFGSSSKTKANDKLPMLNHILSYPTTIFLDKKGKVRKIHTGFNGPATGNEYIKFKTEFEKFIDVLIKE